MSESVTCEEVQAALFELRRRELTDLRRSVVSEHLRTCDECRKMAMKTGQMFGAAGGDDVSLWGNLDADALFERLEESIDDRQQVPPDTDGQLPELDEMFEVAQNAEFGVGDDIDADALFERIEESIDHQQQAPDTDGQLPGLDEMFEVARNTDIASGDDIDADALFERIADEVTEDKPGDHRPGAPRASRDRRVWGAIAAAACAALVGWWLFSAPQIEQPQEPTTTSPTAEQPGEEAEPTDDAGAAGELATLQPAYSPAESLRLFTEHADDYELESDDDTDTVKLAEGTMLVEMLPEHRRQFTLKARSHVITVTGTVFSVQIIDDIPRVSVYEGAVKVTDPDGTTHRVDAGDVRAGDDRGRIDDAGYAAVERYVDLEEHRRALVQANTDAIRASESELFAAVGRADSSAQDAVPDPGPAPPAEISEEDIEADDAEPEEPSAHQLHEQALDALHEQQPELAAELLTEALELTDPDDQARADVLLELARIHLRDLDDPQQTADYLNRFVEQWPDDPAADAIRHQLCEMDVDVAECE